jgi:hypothetical protein
MPTQIDPQILYHQIGGLLADVPAVRPWSQDAAQWAAKAYAVIKSGGEKDDADAVRRFVNLLPESYAAEELIIDPYMDGIAVTKYAVSAPETVTIRLLAHAKDHKPTLKPAIQSWQTQYPTRPMEGRLAASKRLHDRLIIIDRKDVWNVTQSLNALAARSPAEILKTADAQIATDKTAHYEAEWQAAALI